MARGEPQLKVRLPQMLKETVERSAQNARRTINNEVVYQLENAYGLTAENAERAA